jgi:hypothetical protein
VIVGCSELSASKTAKRNSANFALVAELRPSLALLALRSLEPHFNAINHHRLD